MVKIRLMRVGKKKQPSFRVVVADSRSPRDGRIIEAIGHYQPRLEPSEVAIDNDRAVHWLRNGAQPSGQVRHLLEISGAWAAFTGKEVVRTPASPDEAKKKATPAASVASEPKEATGAAAEESGLEVPAEPTSEEPAAVALEAESPEAEEATSEAGDETDNADKDAEA